MRNARAVRLVCSLTGLAIFTADALGQSYPTRPIQLVVAQSPGGGVNFIARLLGTRLAESLGQPVIVDNRPGAGGVVGTEYVARAAPDGYTLQIGNNSTHGVNQVFNSKLPYDTLRSFAPITLIAVNNLLLMVPGTLPVKSLKELVTLAKARPGELNYGSGGTGSFTHLTGELFKHITGTRMAHIPYKGTGPAFTALLNGEIQVLLASAAGSMHYVESGRLKALGITGSRRAESLPGVPTFSEQGIADLTGNTYMLIGPAGLPSSVVARLNQETVKIVNTADFKKMLKGQEAEPVGSTPEECVGIIKNEIAKWSKFQKETGIRVD